MMKFNQGLRPLKSEIGLSLINVMLAVAIGSVVVLGITKGLAMMYKTRQTVEFKTDLSLLISRVQQAVGKTQSCRDLLAGATLTTSGVPISSALFASELFEGRVLRPGLEIKDFKLVRSATDVASATSDGKIRQLAYIRISVKDTTSGEEKVSRFRDIPVRVTAVGTTVESCVAETAQDVICDNAAANFDPNAATNQKGKCIPRDRCLWGGAFSTSPYGGFINPRTGGMSCPTGFRSLQGGTINYAQSNSKTQVVNYTYHVTHCLRCDLPTFGTGGFANGTGSDAGFNEWLTQEDAATDALLLQQQNRFNNFLNGFNSL